MRLVVVALLSGAALSSAACHTLRPVTLSELGVARPGTVWVTRADDTFVVVDGPRAFGDTLVGMVNGELEEMPASELKRVRMKRAAHGRTIGLVAGIAAASAAAVLLIKSTGGYQNPADKLDCEDDPYQPGCPLAPP